MELDEVFLKRLATLIARNELKLTILQNLLVKMGVSEKVIQDAFGMADNGPELEAAVQEILNFMRR